MSNKSPSTRQKIALQAMANGATLKEAGELAGYATPQNRYDAMKRLADRIGPLMDRLGLTEEYIVKSLKEAMQANRTELAQYKGEFTDIAEVPDNPTRIKAIEAAARIRRMFPEREVEDGDKSTVAVQIITNVKLDKP